MSGRVEQPELPKTKARPVHLNLILLETGLQETLFVRHFWSYLNEHLLLKQNLLPTSVYIRYIERPHFTDFSIFHSSADIGEPHE